MNRRNTRVRPLGAIVLAAVAMAFPGAARAQGPSPDVVIRNATVLTISHGRIENGSVLIRDGKIVSVGADVKPQPARKEATFMGIKREDGRVATRNYIGILSSVNCSATAARAIADHFSRQTNPAALADYPMVDGVVALTHGTGCGMDTEGLGMQILERTLAGYATHANFWGVLVVGLGCERNQVAELVASQGLERGPLLQTLVMQEVGGTQETIEAGIRAAT